MPFETYCASFCPLSKQCEGYGDRVFDGMMELFVKYPRNHQMMGTIYYGWFALPDPFSKIQAKKPRTDMETKRYPTIIINGYDTQSKTIACEHMLIKGTRPWSVHESRVKNYVVAGFLRHAV